MKTHNTSTSINKTVTKGVIAAEKDEKVIEPNNKNKTQTPGIFRTNIYIETTISIKERLGT